MFTIAPPPLRSSARPSAWQHRKTPSTLTSSTFPELLERHVLGGSGVGDAGAVDREAQRAEPGLDAATAASTPPESVTSAGTATRAAAGGLDRGDRAGDVAPRGSTQPTSAPASARPMAISRPMPEAAPVTSATAWSRRKEGSDIRRSPRQA